MQHLKNQYIGQVLIYQNSNLITGFRAQTKEIRGSVKAGLAVKSILSAWFDNEVQCKKDFPPLNCLKH